MYLEKFDYFSLFIAEKMADKRNFPKKKAMSDNLSERGKMLGDVLNFSPKSNGESTFHGEPQYLTFRLDEI